MDKRELQISCPYCGARIIDGLEATKITLQCKRCKTWVIVSFDNHTIHMEITKIPKPQHPHVANTT